MDWLLNSPDLNPIENFWAITKRRVYIDRQQFNSPDAYWRCIQSVCSNIASTKIQNLISSVDNQLTAVLETRKNKINEES